MKPAKKRVEMGTGLKRALQLLFIFTATICSTQPAAAGGPLAWPIACVPGLSCLDSRTSGIGYPDIGTNPETFQCRTPAYKGHSGTDIYVTSVDIDSVIKYSNLDQLVLYSGHGKDRYQKTQP